MHYIFLALVVIVTSMATYFYSPGWYIPYRSEPPVCQATKKTIEPLYAGKPLTFKEAKVRLDCMVESTQPRWGLTWYHHNIETRKKLSEINYDCPLHDSRTHYSAAVDKNFESVADNIEFVLWPARVRIALMAGLDVTLDESEFCRKCHPDIKKPELILIVRYPDKTEPWRYGGIEYNDLEYLDAFSKGDVGYFLVEKGRIARLAKILGISSAYSSQTGSNGAGK